MEQTTLIYHFVVLPGSFVSIFFFEENGKTTLLKNYCSKWYVKTRNYCVIYFVDNDSKLTFAAVSPGSILLVQS